MRYILVSIIGMSICLYMFITRISNPIEFVLLTIIWVLCAYLLPKKNRFEGYVCELCGSEYNKCEHQTLEYYTLVKKS